MCGGKEEEDFKPFPTQLLLLYLPTCLTTDTTHTLTIMKKQETHALGWLHRAMPRPPYPALGQGRVALFPCLL